MGSSKNNCHFILEEDFELEPKIKNEPIYEVYSQEAEEAYYDSNSNDSSGENKNQTALVKNDLNTYNDYEEDSDEEDDIKMINATQLLMNKIDENLSKITYIDLTQDEEDQTKKEKNQPKENVSPIVICEKSSSDRQPFFSKKDAFDSPILIKPKQTDSYSKSKKNEPACISLVDDDENSTELMNFALIQFCDEKEQEYNQKLTNSKNDEKNIKIGKENNIENEDDFINVSKLKEIESKIYEKSSMVIQTVNEPLETSTLNLEKTDKEQENTGKKVLLNLKRIREIVSSSDEEQDTLNNNSSFDKTSSKRPFKRLISSSDESEENKSISKTETPFHKSDYFKQYSNKKPPPHSISNNSPSTNASKASRTSSLSTSVTPQKSIERTDLINKKNSKSVTKLSTGEVLGTKRTILVENPPESMKIRKKSIKSPNGLSKSTSNETLKCPQPQPQPHTSILASSSSSTASPVFVDISLEPDINSIDMAKKEAIERMNKKNCTSLVPSKQLPKAYEQIKSLKCKESGALKKYMDTTNKKWNASGPIGLTQTMNLAKIENQRRLESIMNDKSNQTKEDTNKFSSIKNMPKTIPVIEPSSSKILPQTKPQPQKTSFIKPIFLNKNVNENDKNISNTSNNNRQPQEKKTSSDNDKSNQSNNNQNDLVGNIMHSMNKQNKPQLPKATKDFVYKFENFIYRIVKCNYDWLKEQGKLLSYIL